MRYSWTSKFSLWMALILVLGIQIWIQPSRGLADYGASALASGKAEAAALDAAINGNASSQVRVSAIAGLPGEKISTAVTFTNIGTLPAQFCLVPPAQSPKPVRILTAKTCLVDLKPQTPIKMTLEWEILSGAAGSYELVFQVTLANGFMVSKELVLTGQVSSPMPTASSTPSRTPALTATPASQGERKGTSLGVRITAVGFYEKAVATSTPTTTPTLENRSAPTAEPRLTYGVQGEICVTNTGSQLTERLSIFDQVEYKDEKGQYKPLSGAALAIPVDRELAPKETRCFPYRIEFDPQGHTVFRSSAQAVILNHSGWLPKSKNCPGPAACPYGPTVKVDFKLPEPASATPTATAKPKEPGATATPTAMALQSRPSQTAAAALPQPTPSLTPTSTPTRTPEGTAPHPPAVSP